MIPFNEKEIVLDLIKEAFKLPKEDNIIIEVGKTDIILMKKQQKFGTIVDTSNGENITKTTIQKKKVTSCEQSSSFDYKPLNISLLRNNRTTFTPKRVVVIQLNITEEENKQNAENQIIKNQNELFSLSKLPNYHDLIVFQLENMTETKYVETLFDSRQCEWSIYNSPWIERIKRKTQLILLITTEENIQFGAFIGDEKSFLFKSENNQLIQEN